MWLRSDVAPIQRLAWELPCAAGAALKKKERGKKKRKYKRYKG